MDWKKTDEQELLLKNLREFGKRHITNAKVQQWYADRCVPDELTRAYVDMGFGLLGIPEELGGTPCSVVTNCMVIEEYTRFTGGLLPFFQNSLAIYDMVEFGTTAQIKLVMDLYRETGKACFAIAISEPNAGSDNQSMTTTAKSIDGKIVVNGRKVWVTNGEYTPYILLIAKDEDPSPQNRNMSMWIFPKKTPGVTVKKLNKIGQTILPFAELTFENVVIDESCLVGQRGYGFMQLMKNFEMERCIVGAQSLGLAQAAMEDAAEYASHRIAFGQPIGNFQLVQEKLTDMEIKLRNMRAMVYKTAWEIDENIPVQLDAALLKRHVPKAAVEVCYEALQILAGIGYTSDARVGRMWIDARGNEIAGGTDEIMVHIAGRQILKKYDI